MKYSRLTVIGNPFFKKINTNSTYARSFVKVKCDCGKKITVLLSNLKKGHTQSCGCLRIERIKATNTTHGMSVHGRSPIYHLWIGMKNRCYNPNNIKYNRYGGRGITHSQSIAVMFMTIEEVHFSHCFAPATLNTLAKRS